MLNTYSTYFLGIWDAHRGFKGDLCRSAYTSLNSLLTAHLLCAFLQVSLLEHPFLNHHPGIVARFLENMSVKSGGHRHGGGGTGAADSTYLPSDKLPGLWVFPWLCYSQYIETGSMYSQLSWNCSLTIKDQLPLHLLQLKAGHHVWAPHWILTWLLSLPLSL